MYKYVIFDQHYISAKQLHTKITSFGYKDTFSFIKLAYSLRLFYDDKIAKPTLDKYLASVYSINKHN